MAKAPVKKTSAKKTAKKAPAKKAAPKKVTKAVKEAMVLEKEINKLSKDKKAPAKKGTATKPKGIRPERSTKDSTADQAMILAKTVAQGMFEKKAENIRILDMRNVKGASADFFVISHADSDKQVEAIANSADEETRKILNEKPWHKEGFENLEWVLLDYIDVVAHIFQREKREYYAVEELWGDAKEVVFKGK
ncbi:MAG: ribosome silencing factor [Bacteroidota bacterium]